jgi:Arc/MetJ family transcription regulator
MRTNIEIEDTYLQVVMDRYGLRTTITDSGRALLGRVMRAQPPCPAAPRKRRLAPA